MVEFKIHDFGQVICASKNHVKAFLDPQKFSMRSLNFTENNHHIMIDEDRPKKSTGSNIHKTEPKPSGHSSGAPYIIQVKRNQTVEELRCVGADLRRADDGTVPCGNGSETLVCGAKKPWLKSIFSWVTCCDSPYQRHQALLDGTAPAPHDQHQSKRLSDHHTLVQRGGLLQPNRIHKHTAWILLGKLLIFFGKNNTLDCRGRTECSECKLRIIPKIWRGYIEICMSHQVSFQTLRLHPLLQVVDGIKCLVLD